MKPRPPAPAGASVITVRAKSHDALMSATAKTVAAMKVDNHSEPLLVVYANNAAIVFCEQTATSVKVGLQR